MKPKYEIGVYYFPGYHADPRVSSWHGKDWTEWRLLCAAKPRFKGHQQPKCPLWGYEDESSPAAMKKKAEAAFRHGVNHFIFDWYHYEGKPFLNGALDDGFLKIKGGPRLKFALMWANHDWLNIQPASFAGGSPLLLSGLVDAKGFEKITAHVIERYFKSPHYWTIDGCPYFSIYDLPNLIRGLGGVARLTESLAAFRRRVERAGFPGLHLNLVHWQNTIVGSEHGLTNPVKTISRLKFDSISSYVWIHHYPEKRFVFPETDYVDVLNFNAGYWRKTSQQFQIPYFPNVTMGWDASPRCAQTDDFAHRSYPFMPTLKGNTPANFRRALVQAKAHVDSLQLPARHFSINAWNEWTEGSYLEPDEKNGFAYLEAIRDVFGAG
jgi:Glycosyltransferase WbsX